jgi:uncharacterized protein
MILFNYPLKIGDRGRTLEVSEERHIHQLIEQVLFCSPGERINRPSFGAALNQLIFAGNNDQLASVTQSLISSSLQQWLGDLIHVESVNITNEESTLRISVQYRLVRNQQQQVGVFTREIE